jgi:NADH-quinone oxidoreductase subunit F
MAVTDAPKIISTRFDQPDGHTLAGYERTGGYAALRSALGRAPADVLAEVKAANIQGRGGAGFPAGTKWGFLPADVHPRYLVVNGDESEPGTYKDRLLMELDPHQLIEGVLLASYAVEAKQAFIYVRGEMAVAQERLAAALNEAYAAGLVGRDIAGSGWSMDVLLHWGRVPTSWARRRPSSRASRAGGACPASSRRTSRRSRACTCSPRSSTTSRPSPTSRGS